jgi:hypothetical protein
LIPQQRAEAEIAALCCAWYKLAMDLRLKPETEAKIAAYAAAQGVSVDNYLEALVEKQLPEHTATTTVFEQGLGLFGSPEDAALLDEVVSLAYEERRRPTRSVESL